MATKAKPSEEKKAAPEKEAPGADKPAAEKPPRKMRGKLIIAVASVLLLIGGGAAAWYFSGSSNAEAKPATGAAAKAAKATAAPGKPVKPPVFLTLPQFTVNLLGEGTDQYLQTTIVFEMTDEEASEAVKAQMPIIRSRLLLLLSSKTPADLAGLEGKEKLVQEIMAESRKYVRFASAEQKLNQVHFNSFVIQ